ncbi:MAG: sulfite exporter TauE/SafE family protein [Candidatus Zipacnadales bacterium]
MSLFTEYAHDVPLLFALFCLIFASLFIGIGKAGFGGGVGLVSPVLYAQILPVRVTLALMQPLLMVCDMAAIVAWWKQWDTRNLGLLLPGTVVGVMAGSVVLTSLPERYLAMGLGLLCLLFVVLQILRQQGTLTGGTFRPVWWHGALVGATAGFCSLLAHAASPIITLFLLPQNLGKRRFVATTVLYFTVLNAIKLPFFLATGMLSLRLFLSALLLAPLVVLGALLGVWMNRQVSETAFTWIVYAMVVLSAVRLLAG